MMKTPAVEPGPNRPEAGHPNGPGDETAAEEAVAGLASKHYDARTVGILIVAAASVLAVLKYAQAVLIPLVLSGLFFYALDPSVDRLQRWHIPRAIGAALVLLLCAGAVGVAAAALAGQAMTVVEQLPAGIRKLQAQMQPGRNEPGTLDKVQRAATELDQAAADAAAPTPAPKGVMRVQVEEPALRATSYLWTGSLGIVALAGQTLMVLFLTYFLLVADDLFKRKLVKHIGSTFGEKKLTVQIIDEIGLQIQRFLVVQIFSSALVAIVTAVCLWWLGLQQAAIWGVVAGVFNSIPYFGPLIVTAGLATVGFLQFESIEMTAIVAGVALAITTVEGWLLTPILMGRVGQLNHIAIFVSLLLWSWMWGVWGMLLAVPMLMVLKSVADHAEGLQPVADFLAEE